jgi:membrane protease YdiL (CAAX protease family)
MFKDTYVSPGGNVPQLDILGKIMLIPLGATVYLSLRRLEGSGFRLAISRADFTTGLKNYFLFLPLGIPLGILIGFVRWNPAPMDSWTYVFEVAGKMLGVYATLALAEEMFFRGILQNLLSASLGRPLVAQLIASVLFGAVHLPRGFPNWRYALLAAVAGWFYGRAYVQGRGVVASSVTHVLVVVTMEYLFPRN